MSGRGFVLSLALADWVASTELIVSSFAVVSFWYALSYISYDMSNRSEPVVLTCAKLGIQQ